MSPSAERLDYVLKLTGAWVDTLPPDEDFEAHLVQWDARNEEFLATCNDPVELFTFANAYNRDDGCEPLARIVANPACDRSTLMRLFWAYEIDELLQYATSDDVPDYHRDIYGVVMAARVRLLAGDFLPAASPFNPEHINGPRPAGLSVAWEIDPAWFDPILVE